MSKRSIRGGWVTVLAQKAMGHQGIREYEKLGKTHKEMLDCRDRKHAESGFGG